ncbi:MAG TPA: hypothetical protein VHD87_13010 [Acidimicrobiales bacterium]|nr:hypothetical protein [Acidimicrobiales bacterium]
MNPVERFVHDLAAAYRRAERMSREQHLRPADLFLARIASAFLDARRARLEALLGARRLDVLGRVGAEAIVGAQRLARDVAAVSPEATRFAAAALAAYEAGVLEILGRL